MSDNFDFNEDEDATASCLIPITSLFKEAFRL